MNTATDMRQLKKGQHVVMGTTEHGDLYIKPVTRVIDAMHFMVGTTRFRLDGHVIAQNVIDPISYARVFFPGETVDEVTDLCRENFSKMTAG